MIKSLFAKLDRFRSSTLYYFIAFLSQVSLTYISLNNVIFAKIIELEFYRNLILLFGSIYTSWFFGKVFLKRYDSNDMFIFLFTNLQKTSKLLYSSKTQKDTFEPIIADWQEEYFKALFKKEIWKARWINVRYTYAFISAMWQKSPIGDLIEFVRKIAS